MKKIKNLLPVSWLSIASAVIALLIFFNSSRLVVCTLSLMVASLAITILLTTLLVHFFGDAHYKNGIGNIIVGDEGGYSLSRLQAVVWAIIIIAYQVAALIAMLNSALPAGFQYYQSTFSESSIWLLGLSLSSYIIVKGITVDRISRTKRFKARQPQWSDLLTDNNGIDFSRCQMFIWTIVALFVFISKCYYFLAALLEVKDEAGLVMLLNNFYEEYKPDASLKPPYVPYLPFSFIVLMGLSQGAYLGKKLIPVFKINEMQELKETALNEKLSETTAKQSLLAEILEMNRDKKHSALDKQTMENLEMELRQSEADIMQLQQELRNSNRLKNE